MIKKDRVKTEQSGLDEPLDVYCSPLLPFDPISTFPSLGALSPSSTPHLSPSPLRLPLVFSLNSLISTF